MKKLLLLSIALFSIISIYAQRGKDGAKVVTTTEVVNAFTTLSVDAAAGNTSITVTNSALNTNFAGNLAAGDLILIYQAQGVTVEDTIGTPHFPNSSKFNPTWGRIISYNNAGNYEFLQVKSVPNATTIELDCELTKDFTAAGRVLVIRVPRYSSLTIDNGGVLTTSQWNGTSGGVLAVEVDSVTTINSGGSINTSALGFRGGVGFDASSVFGGTRYADANVNEGAKKGEGIAGDATIYATFNSGGAAQCRGAAANAGGGGNSHNAGGGGGSNAGNINNWNNGVGNPDISTANFITAWNLETVQSGLSSATVSSGGGRGGYSFFSTDRNELTTAPGNTNWGGDNRGNVGGLGGRPLDYSLGKFFIGGAGGAGEGNDNEAGNGGNGGGLIFLKTYDAITGAGNIISNGGDGGDVVGNSPPAGEVRGKDGAGGAGAGGTIILQTTGVVTLSGSISANGGVGGNQQLAVGAFGAGAVQGEGPGGGGGGGYIAISAGTPTRTANGGVNGVTNCSFVANFPPNGATMGGVGMPNETITAFDLITNDETICPNTTATLTASVSGTAPAGAVIEWYDAEFNGALLQTGNSFTTPVLAAQTTYYVKTCPGTFTVPVTVFIDVCGTPPVASFSSSDTTFCVGTCINFTDLSINTPSGWSWHFFGSDTPTSSSQNPTNICYSTAGTFDVALVSSNPSGSDSLFIADFITVNALPTIVTSPDTSICIGDAVNLTASGGTTYLWDNGLGLGQNQTDSPTLNTTYTVYVTDVNLCLDSAQVDVTINSLPTITASNDTTICTGDAVNLTANGGLTYFWDNGLGAGQSHSPTPLLNTTYNVIGTDVNGCENTDQVVVTVGVCGLPPISSFSSSDSTICVGDCIDFTDLSQNLPTGWTWYFFGATTTNSIAQNPTNICYNTAGSFDVALVTTNTNGSDSLFIANFITVNALPVITTSTDTAICSGDNVNLTANGANTYTWDNGLGAGQSQTAAPIVFTTYTVTGTDLNGCVNTAQVDISINSLPLIFTSPDTTVCSADTLKLTAGGALTYVWDNGIGAGANHNVFPTVNTTYTVVGTDANGCSNSSLVNVIINGLPTVIASNDTIICNGASATISASGTVIYNWDNGLGLGPVKTVSPITNTTYIVTGIDANGCRDTDQVTVSVISCTPPTADLTASDTSICINDCVDFTDLTSNSPTNWTWYFFGSSTANSINQNPTNVCYTAVGSFDVALVVNNAFGSDSIFFDNYITVDSCIVSPTPIDTVVPEPIVVVPNVFTPNNDGQNDLFKVGGTGIKELTIVVYNRWGQVVFETNQINAGWDGRTNSGIEVPEGTYFYVIEVTTTTKETYTGYVTLIR
jgi:gliding motility-associated-like protein